MLCLGNNDNNEWYSGNMMIMQSSFPENGTYTLYLYSTYEVSIVTIAATYCVATVTSLLHVWCHVWCHMRRLCLYNSRRILK